MIYASPAFTVPRCDSASPTPMALGSNCGSGAIPGLNRFLLAVCLLLAACSDERGPHWEDVCTNQIVTYIPVWSGKSMIIIPQYHCTKYTRKCVVGKDYRGAEKQCQLPPDKASLFLEPPHNLGAHNSNRHKAGVLVGSPSACTGAAFMDTPPLPSPFSKINHAHRIHSSSVRCSSEHRGSAIAKWQKSLDAS